MRRGLASLIMGLSLTVASASWAGFVLSHTVLDPGRSERLADHLLDNSEVRAVLIDRIADQLETQIPASIPVPRQSLELAASIALDDPRVETIVRDGIVKAHQNALNGVDEPIMIDAGELGDAARDALVQEIPQLDLILPASPAVPVEVPGTGLSWLGTVKRLVDRYTLLGALVSLVGVTTAFVLARNRPAALRRVAYWAFASAAFWLAVAYALPSVARTLAPSSAAIASAAVDVFVGAMVRPALYLAAAGVVLLVASFVWPSVDKRRPAALLDQGARGRDGGRSRGPSRAAGPREPVVDGPRPTSARPAGPPLTGSGAVPAGAPAGYDGTAYDGLGYDGPTRTFGAGPGGAAGSGPGPGGRSGPTGPAPVPVFGSAPPAAGHHSLAAEPEPDPDPTREYPVISSAAQPVTAIAPDQATPERSGWVEGVGYVDPASGLTGPAGWDRQPAPNVWGADPGPDGPDPVALFDEAPTTQVPVRRDRRGS